MPASAQPATSITGHRLRMCASRRANQQAAPPEVPEHPTLLQSFEAMSAVIALHWLDVDGLGVATSSGYFQVFDASGILRDQVAAKGLLMESRLHAH